MLRYVKNYLGSLEFFFFEVLVGESGKIVLIVFIMLERKLENKLSFSFGVDICFYVILDKFFNFVWVRVVICLKKRLGYMIFI